MTIIEDTRNQKGKHKKKHEWFQENGIEVYRSKLEVGDYSLPNDRSVCIDTKKDLQELCGNVGRQHERFREELERAEKFGIKLIILCEHGNGIKKLTDVKNWKNPRTTYSSEAMTGEKLYQILCTMEQKYNCRFEFCSKEETAKRIIKLLMSQG